MFWRSKRKLLLLPRLPRQSLLLLPLLLLLLLIPPLLGVVLGVVELVLHWGLDVAKCNGRTNFAFDQIAHVACKAVYVIVGTVFLAN